MWQEKNNKLYQKFVFQDFEEAISFINGVAEIASELNHHPEIKNTYNTVELSLSTHESGDVVTEKDREFALEVDALINIEQDTSAVGAPKQVKLYTDGGSRGNPGPSATGYALLDQNNEVIVKKGEYIGITTNNQAEYKALLFGLKEAKRLGVTVVNVFMDSQLIVNQMTGAYKIRNEDLLPIYKEIKLLIENFDQVTFTHVPRELNKLADSMVNEALDAQ